MRLLLAAITVFGSMLLFAAFVDRVSPHGVWPRWATTGLAMVFMLSLAGSLFVFNRPGLRPSRLSPEQRLAEMREKGLLEEERYTARRAFAVEEFEDLGPNYFLELTDGRTLFLSGQYLCDYEPIDDDPDENRPRLFPCAEFTVQRHRTTRFTLGLLCGGEMLEPEATAPTFTAEDYRRELYEDGMIFADRSYDDLKRERLAPAATRSRTPPRGGSSV